MSVDVLPRDAQKSSPAMSKSDDHLYLMPVSDGNFVGTTQSFIIGVHEAQLHRCTQNMLEDYPLAGVTAIPKSSKISI